ncbi:acyl transferase 5-like [Ananas comosus]|uniref:Acyl transferase 5-like n=1 Tax=Ananas comosus TaxID=4615 RepID=A0A6P5GC12_ANACO|nr:acyl transferase 5-like [Ananas comosus]
MANSCTITKKPPILVRACEATPRGSHRLSFLDRRPEIRLSLDVLLVFRRGGGEDPAKTIREGLSRALVHYYPVAGRIAEPAGGELAIECSGDGDGVWFVEASAEGRLDGFGDWDLILRLIFAAGLVARPPPEVNMENVIFMMQVTEFKCGGFTVGITYNHTVFDGAGSAQFLNAVAELTRGLAEPTVSPTWCRELIPSPPRPTTSAQGPEGPKIQFTFDSFKLAEFDISLQSVKQVKDRVTAETGQSCSTFDVVTAVVWQSRTRAINLDPDADVGLSFMANARHVLHELLSIEGGYYGNCVYTAGITLPSKQVANASLVVLVGLIREAKRTVSDGFSRWMNGDGATNLHALQDYRMLTVTDWNRLGYCEIDFGWGEPSFVYPCGCSSEFNVVCSCAFLKLPMPKQGIRLVMHCVEEQHSAALHDELMKFA